MKYFKYIILSLSLFFSFGQVAQAEGEVCNVNNQEQCEQAESAKVIGNSSEHTEDCDKTIYVFYGEECPHCQELDAYLKEMNSEHPEISIKYYEVWHNNDNLELFEKMSKERGSEAKNVPTVFVGHQTFIGYASEELTGVEIKKSIYDLYCIDEEVAEKTVTIPLINKTLKYSSLSIPVLTVILGIIDGFNPCAMWALIALLSVLIATEDRKKIRIVGISFIASSWLIYYLFMAFYLNTFQVLTFVTWIRYLIGALAIVAGGMYLRDFFTYQPGVCKVTNPKQQRTLIERMKKVAAKNSVWLIILGVVAISFSVNLVEMMCSLGLPVVYTQILALSDLPSWQYYLYLALYNTLYMLDDIIVLIIAITTMNFVHLNNKYDRAMKLIGGILIFALGVILIFKPSLLSF